MLIAKFAQISQLPQSIEWWAVFFPLFYFGSAIVIYIIHGALGDTDNQLKPPFRLGNASLPPIFMSTFMWSLIVAEIGGFMVLFYGVLVVLL